MFTKARKFVAAGVTALLAFAGVVATESPSFATLSGTQFDPGLIISDSVFFDWGTMTSAQIQSFLNARVATCTNDRGEICLKSRKEDIIGSPALNSLGFLHHYSLHICADVPAATNQTSAQIIYKVAVACRINPRVLLVTLQKEQGLVSSPNPTTYMYKAAMGYNCPDSNLASCGQDSIANSRLFYQMYRAAWQLRWYGDPRGSFTTKQVGKTYNIAYNPLASCGSKAVTIKSQATADLYYYTPYTPNAAALANLWGSGDSCSAYGNRNFWRQFWTWFGSPIGGGYILQSSTSQIYLVNPDTNRKYLLTSALATDFQPLGPLGSVSATYLNSFTDAGNLTPLVSDSTGTNHYLIANGFKYPVADSTAAADLGLVWSQSVALTDVQLSNFPTMALAQSSTTGEVFYLQGVNRYLVSGADLIATMSLIGPKAIMSDALLQGFNLGTPVSPLVQDTAGNRYDLAASMKIPISTSALATAIGRDWSGATTIATATLNKVKTAAFMKATGTTATYFLSDGSKHLANAAQLESLASFGPIATVSADYLGKFTTGSPVTSLLKNGTDNWYIAGTSKYKITQAKATAIGLDWTKSLTATTAQLATLSSPILMKASATGTTYLIDDFVNRYPLAADELTNYAGLGITGIVPTSYLESFTLKTDPGRFVSCDDGYRYFLSGTTRYRVSSATAAKNISPDSFPTASFSYLPTLSAAEMSGYSDTTATGSITTYVNGTSADYILENGKRREILDTASLNSALTTVPAVSVLGASAFSFLPLGLPIASSDTIFQNAATSGYGVYSGGSYYSLNAEMYNAVKSSPAWHFTTSTGKLSGTSIAVWSQGGEVPMIGVNSAGTGYVLTSTGKRQISDISNVVATPKTIASSILANADFSADTPLTTPITVKSADTGSSTYVVYRGIKRAAIDSAEGAKMALLAPGGVALIWPNSVLAAITNGKPLIAAGTIVKVQESGNIYLIDGYTKGLKITQATANAFRALTPKIVTAAKLAGYNTSTYSLAWQKVTCAGAPYLVDNGKLLPIDSAAVAQYPSSSVTLSSLTCRALAPSIIATHAGTFMTYSTAKYVLKSGKLHLIRTNDEYTAMLGSLSPAFNITTTLFKALPKGNPTSYVVISGDTLASVATKFKTTATALRNLNHLTSDTLRVGQVLVLP